MERYAPSLVMGFTDEIAYHETNVVTSPSEVHKRCPSTAYEEHTIFRFFKGIPADYSEARISGGER